MEVIVFPFLIIVAIFSLYRGIRDVIRESKYQPEYKYPEYKVPTRWQFPFKIVWSSPGYFDSYDFDYSRYLVNSYDSDYSKYLVNDLVLDPLGIWGTGTLQKIYED